MTADASALLEKCIRLAGMPWEPIVRKCSFASEQAGTYIHPGYRLQRGSTCREEASAAFLRLESVRDGEGRDDTPARAFLLDDVTVFGSGFVVLKGDQFIRESRYIARRNVNGHLTRSLSAGAPAEVADDIVWILAANASTNNYWHWLAQSLPAILQCKDMLEVLRKPVGLLTHPLQPYHEQCLELVGLAGLRRMELRPDQSVRLPALAYSNLLGGECPYHPSEYRWLVRQHVLRTLPLTSRPGSRVYASRSDTKKRQLLNEPALERALQREGFEVVNMGSLPVRAQAELFNNAELVVAPHGAALANNLFCGAQTRVVELAQCSYPNIGPASLMKTSGGSLWWDVFDDDNAGPRTSGWTADIDSVLATIELASAGEAPTTLGFSAASR